MHDVHMTCCNCHRWGEKERKGNAQRAAATKRESLSSLLASSCPLFLLIVFIRPDFIHLNVMRPLNESFDISYPHPVQSSVRLFILSLLFSDLTSIYLTAIMYTSYKFEHKRLCSWQYLGLRSISHLFEWPKLCPFVPQKIVLQFHWAAYFARFPFK